MPSGSETILALDLATKCGFAVLKGRHRIESGRWALLSSRKGRHRGERWLNFESNAMAAVEKHAPDVVAFERVRRHVGTTAAHVYGGLLAQLEMLDLRWLTMAEAGLITKAPEVMPVEIGTWKKATVGHGSAIKLEVGKYVKRRFRYTAKSEDEADALAIAEAVRLIRRGEYTP